MTQQSNTPTRAATETSGWHFQPAAQVLEGLATSPAGLESREAALRLRRHGPNRLPDAKPRGPLRRFFAQINNALIWLLLIAAVIAWGLDHHVDAGAIVGVVVINAIVGFIQEGKAEQALAAIRKMISPHASVLRDGKRSVLDVAAIVPGDIVFLEAGDRVPADLRLLRSRGLIIDEAALTGESVPVEKHEGAAPPRRSARRPLPDGLFGHARHQGPGDGRGRRHRP